MSCVRKSIFLFSKNKPFFSHHRGRLNNSTRRTNAHITLCTFRVVLQPFYSEKVRWAQLFFYSRRPTVSSTKQPTIRHIFPKLLSLLPLYHSCYRGHASSDIQTYLSLQKQKNDPRTGLQVTFLGTTKQKHHVGHCLQKPQRYLRDD